MCEAEANSASFVVLAPIFEKVRTNAKGIGLDALRPACVRSQARNSIESQRQDSFPVLALGGVTLSNASACVEAGASGIAGIRLFQNGDVFDTVKRLRDLDNSRR